MGTKIKVILGDITKVHADAIVNAANTSLLGGGGVDGAIHRLGGAQILEDCRKIIARQGGCRVGEAVYTTAGNLPAKYVIHTVGPFWKNGEMQESYFLTKCYQNSLKLADELECKTIAFPSISTGIYRFPKDLAAQIAIKAITDYMASNSAIEEVILVAFEEEDKDILNNALTF
ncbi:O-acetyl-ADP-ribose deacetylase [Sphingobacterium kyonggiense]